ncbi:hypothetical protein V8C43DRAFT_209490 [Trichoderma afarasin]
MNAKRNRNRNDNDIYAARDPPERSLHPLPSLHNLLGECSSDACKAAWPWASSSGSRCVILYGPCNIFKPLCLFLLQPFVLSAQTKHAGQAEKRACDGFPSFQSDMPTDAFFPSSSSSLLLKLSPRSTAQRPVPRTSSTRIHIQGSHTSKPGRVFSPRLCSMVVILESSQHTSAAARRPGTQFRFCISKAPCPGHAIHSPSPSPSHRPDGPTLFSVRSSTEYSYIHACKLPSTSDANSSSAHVLLQRSVALPTSVS